MPVASAATYTAADNRGIISDANFRFCGETGSSRRASLSRTSPADNQLSLRKLSQHLGNRKKRGAKVLVLIMLSS
jgi:hypothetical protein